MELWGALEYMCIAETDFLLPAHEAGLAACCACKSPAVRS